MNQVLPLLPQTAVFASLSPLVIKGDDTQREREREAAITL